MKNIMSLVLGFAVVFVASAVLAHSFRKDGIVVGHPWSRATPTGATVGAGYLKITNNGNDSDTLIGGTFDGSNRVEIHQMKVEGDVMKMREVTGGLEIKPGETVELNPNSYHFMFMGLKTPIADGSLVKGSLLFKKAGKIDVEYKIEPIGASGSADNHQH